MGDTWKYSLNIKNDYLWNYEINTYILDRYLWKINTNIIKDYKVDFIKEEVTKVIDKKEQLNNSEININKIKEVKINEKSEEIDVIITVQWKIGNNKILNWNKITCIWTCSINFDASESKWKLINYFWNFWNWEEFEWTNPWYIKYKDYWSYILELKWLDWYGEKYLEYFYITFVPKETKIKEKNINILLNENIKKELDNEQEVNNIDYKKINKNIYFIIFIIILSLVLWIILLKRKKII